MQPVKRIRARTVVMPNPDIDTDQIIPARFLTTTSKEGLGNSLFCDLRYDSDGEPVPEFPLNSTQAQGAEILVAGHNFGCGSSREHAPWALVDYGIRAVISTGIADIFRSNALKNGLLPVVIDSQTHDWLLRHPGAEIEIDVEHSTLTLPAGHTVSYPIDAFARYCLVEGTDQLGFLQQHIDEIHSYEEGRS